MLAQHQNIQELRQMIEDLEHSRVGAGCSVLPFGIDAIDSYLPHNGIALGELHEVSGAEGIAHEAAATQFLAGILARMDGPVLWCVRTRDLFAPGLALSGLYPDRVLFAEAGDEKTMFIVMEDGAKHRGLAAVVGELHRLPVLEARRLHLAARDSGVTVFALRRQSRHQKTRSENAPAATRWRIADLPSQSLGRDMPEQKNWKIELTRCRGADPKTWIMEACNEKGYLGLATNFANRSSTETVWSASA